MEGKAEVPLRAKNYDVQFDDGMNRWVVVNPAGGIESDHPTQSIAVNEANKLHDRDEAAAKPKDILLTREEAEPGGHDKIQAIADKYHLSWDDAVKLVSKERDRYGMVKNLAPESAAEPAKSDLEDEYQSIINEAAAKMDVPVRSVDETDPNQPFSSKKAIGIATIDRKTGTILVNQKRMARFLGAMSPDRRAQAIRSILGHERIHLAATDEDAITYLKSLSGLEVRIGKSIYSMGSTLNEMSDTLWGHELLRQRIEKLSGWRTEEVINAVGKQRWKLESLNALESVVRNIRTRLGTNISPEIRAILDRVQSNITLGKAVASGVSPMAQPGEDETGEQKLNKRQKKNRKADALVNMNTRESISARAKIDEHEALFGKMIGDSGKAADTYGTKIGTRQDFLTRFYKDAGNRAFNEIGEDKDTEEWFVNKFSKDHGVGEGEAREWLSKYRELRDNYHRAVLREWVKSLDETLEFQKKKLQDEPDDAHLQNFIRENQEMRDRFSRELDSGSDQQSFPARPERSKKEDPNQGVFDTIRSAAKFSQMRLAAAGDQEVMAGAEKQKFKDAMGSLAPKEPGPTPRAPNPKAEKMADDVGGLKYIGEWNVKGKPYWMFNITQEGRETTMVVPDTATVDDLAKKKADKIKEYDEAAGQEQFPMSAERGRPSNRKESVNQDKMDFAGASVNTVEEAQKPVPEGERLSAEKAGALPPLSAADLENRADKWMKEQVAATMDKAVKAPTAGGSVALPTFKEFVESMKKQQGGVQPGQLKEMWQGAVDRTLSAASDDQLRAMIQAGFGRESKLARFSRAALSYTKDTPPLELEGEIGVKTSREESAEAAAGRLKRAKDAERPAMFERKASERQEAKEERNAPRRRRMIVSALFKRMVLPAYREDALPQDRKTVTPSEIRYGGGKEISAYQSFDATSQNDPELGKMLVDDARRSGEDPVTTTKRLTVIMDKKSGKVAMVSTYNHPTKGTMLVDPVHPQGHHAPLDDVLKRYRVLYSVLLDQPVKGFKRTFDSVADYNDRFGKEAQGNYSRETSYDPRNVPISEFTEGVEGTEGLEGEGGDVMGPGKKAAMAVTGVGEGASERGSHTPITDVEASAVNNHVVDTLGEEPANPDEVVDVIFDIQDRIGNYQKAAEQYSKLSEELDKIKENPEEGWSEKEKKDAKRIGSQLSKLRIQMDGAKVNPSAISGISKIAQLLQRENPDLTTEELVNKLAQTIYEDKNLEATVARTEKSAAAKAGETARPEVQAKPSETGRDLNMLNRRPPTDVRPENVPPGTMPEFTHNPPVPEATTTPRNPDYLSPEDAEWVNALSLMPEFHADAKDAVRQAAAYKPTEFVPTVEYPEPAKEGERTLTDRPKQPQLKEQSPMSAERLSNELDKKRRQINAVWLRRSSKMEITAAADGADNLAPVAGEHARRTLRLVNKDEMVRSTPIALLACGKVGENPNTGKKFFFYDQKALDSKITQAKLGAIKAQGVMDDPKTSFKEWRLAKQMKAAAERLELIAQYTKDHFKDQDVKDMAMACRRELYDQLVREHEHGVSTTDFGETYFPTRYEGEMFNLDTIRFGSDETIGNRFTARKVFRDHYEAIMHGPFIPKSYDAADIISHRVRQGARAIGRRMWVEALKDMKDAVSGKPIAMDATPGHPRQLVNPDTGEKEFHGDPWQAPSPEYEMIKPTDSGTPIAVLKPYAGLMKTCTAESAFRGSPAGELSVYFSSMLKHGVVLVGDTFHYSRLMQYGTAMRRGVPSFNNGFAALMYRAEDLAGPNGEPGPAVKSGEVYPESAKWALAKEAVIDDAGTHKLMSHQEVLQEMVGRGLNATRIGDAIYKDAVQKIPLVGEVLYKAVGPWNRFLFDRFMPGLISDGAVRNFVKLHQANPDVPYSKLMRDVITDMNVYYGNMGRQGVFTNPTLRDAAQVTMLAPMWQEGLIGKELRTMGRLTGISNLTGRRGVPQLGALGGAVTRGLASYFLLTQAINLVTRRQLTFQNKEKGHELDAWIPTGEKTGIWISPMSVFAEKTHDLIRLCEAKPKAWDAITQMGENALGPVGKFAHVLRSSRSPSGEYLTTTPSVISTAVEQLTPTPISLGKGIQWAGYAAGVSPKPEPGTTWRQMIASGMGIKTQPGQDANTQAEASARKFAQDNMLKSDSQVIIPTDEPSYAKLRHAFKIGDEGSTKKIFDTLVSKRKTGQSAYARREQIVKDMQNWARRPFTGSNNGDRLWIHSMTDAEREMYSNAVQQRYELLYGWEKWYLTQVGNPGQ